MPDGGFTLASRPLAAVAGELGVKERWLRRFIQRHRIPVLRSGRIIRFDDLALRALEEAMRCRSESPAGTETAPLRLAAGSTMPTVRSDEFANALNLTSGRSPKKKPPRSRRDSCATPGTASGQVVALLRQP
jgi:hypothetical protein